MFSQSIVSDSVITESASSFSSQQLIFKTATSCISNTANTFAVGDYVFNQKTRHIGRVIGHGHQILNDVYVPTLKVLVSKASDSRRRCFVEEELYSTWTQCQGVADLTLR